MNLKSVGVWLFCAGIGFAQDSKVQPPEDEARLKAEKQIRNIFKDEYAVKTLTAQKRLAALLRKQGRETKDDSTLQYVLYREAAELALHAGDGDTLLGSVDAICKGFLVDTVSFRGSFLMKTDPAGFGTEDLKKFTKALIQPTRDATDQDQFDAATKTAQAAAGAARKSKDISLAVRADALVKTDQETKSA